jgi:cytosine/adenosine deaminase-related metal-dependent hydrolase
MGADKIAEMAWYNNAALVKKLSGSQVGTIQEGAKADVMLVDYQPFTPFQAGNLPWHVVFGFQNSMVTTTIVDGKILMKDRKILTLDEEEISHQALQLAPRIWERYNQQF